jgi:hypothetical protein
VTSLLALWNELPTALWVPSVAACAAVGALLLRYLLGGVGAWLDDRWRARRQPPNHALTDGAMTVQRGTLLPDGEGFTLRTADATFALEGSLDVRAHGRPLAVAALRAKGTDAIVRGVYRRRADVESAEAYRSASARHAITADGDALTVTVLRASLPLRYALPLALVGAALGGLVGVALPSVVLPRVLSRPPRVPRLQVRSIAYRHVVLNRVATELDPTCPLRLLTPARWGIEREECAPTLTLSENVLLDALIPARLADPTPRATGRSIALAMGWPALATELRVTPGDAGSYVDAIRECFAAARYHRLLELATAMPRAGYPSVVAEVTAASLFRSPIVPPRDTTGAILAAAPDGVSESVACIAAFARDGAAPPPTEALALATRPGAPPACVVLGATAHRGPDALRALNALPPQSAIWQPVVDAARNFVLVEGLATGSIRAPAPSRFEAYGDPAVQRVSLSPAVAHLLDATAALLEARGYVRLAWQVRFPAQEAITRSFFLTTPAYGEERASLLRANEQVDHAAASWAHAIDTFAVASRRDRRLDAATLAQLRADAARFQVEADRLRAIRLLLWSDESVGIHDARLRAVVRRTLDRQPPWPGAEFAFLAPVDVPRALAAVRSRDPSALADALGEPNATSMAAAHIVGTWQHPGDPRPCRADSLVCAWVESALQDPRVAARPWAESRVAQFVAIPRVASEGGQRGQAREWPPGASRYTGGAFVQAVTEALQRSLAAAP